MADWKNNPFIGFILLLIIVVIIAYHISRRPGAGLDGTYSIVLVCTSVNHDEPYRFTMEIEGSSEPPYKCS